MRTFTIHSTRLALAAWLALAGSLAAAQSGQPIDIPSARVDRIFAEWDRRDSPGCAVGIYRDGRIVYERGYGSADLEHDVPITPDSVFYVGSLSKQFTAFAAALAMQQGRLTADDPIRKHLPELPGYADAITVRHLIHHTSGLRDYNTLLSIAGRRGDEAYDNPTVLRMTARQKQLNFQPGAEYLYSNTGYTLLATIVGRATGTPFAEYAEQQIFGPLGMDATHYHVDAGRLVKGRAYAYARGANAWRLDTPSNERAGAGGVYTSVRDLLKWDNNFYDARVGGAALLRQAQTVGALDSGKPLGYAWGLQVGDYRGMRIVEHSGSLGGYRAHLLRFPDQRFSTAVLCNLGSITPGTLARDVADTIIGDRFTEPAPERRAGGGRGGGDAAREPGRPAGSLAEYAGTYESDEIEATFTVLVKDDRLWLRRESDPAPLEMQPSGKDAFRVRGMTFRFERTRSVAALVVDAGRVRDIRFVRVRSR
jgi:CubicO group peptidase (beta-lactamase class C family)